MRDPLTGDAPLLLRLTTVPISLDLLLTGQPAYMREHGFRVLLASADGPEREKVMEREACPHVIIPFTRAITPLHDLRCLGQLVRLMRRLRPDIVHTHTPKAGLLGMLAARLAGVPVRIHTIAGLPYMTASGRRRSLLIQIERITAGAALRVWPNSQSILQEAKDRRLCAPRKLSIIGKGSTNGIDLDEFSTDRVTDERIEQAKERIGHRADRRYVMAVGRLVRDKGILELLEAFEAVHRDYPDVCLVLAGPLERQRAEETLPEGTVRLIDRHPAIVHLPWTDDVPAFLRLADILVHASHREGFPNVLLQAGAMCCPIICSAIPGNTDLVEDGRTGLTFPVGRADALGEKIRFALDAPDTMQALADRLRAKVVDDFRREAVHRTILGRYRALMGRGMG